MKKLYILLLIVLVYFIPQKLFGQCSGIDFSADVQKGCSPLVVEFTAVNVPTGSKLFWDFGNGKVAGNDTVKKIFTTAGLYTISLDITLPNGTKCNQIKKTNYIEAYKTPKPNFSISPSKVICTGATTVTLTDKTSGTATRDWVISGTKYPNGNSPISQMLGVGKHSVTLKVTNSDGCTGIKSETITIYDQPDFDFCANIIQTSSSTVANFRPWVEHKLANNIASYSWKFPGGSPSSSNLKNPSVTYNNVSSPKDVELTITTKDGCKFTYKADEYIQKYAKVSRPQACVNDTLKIITNLTSSIGDPSWSFPGAIIKTIDNNDDYTLLYGNPGTKTFSLSFPSPSDSCMSVVSFQNFIDINGPKASFPTATKYACTAPHKFSFNSNSSVPSTGTTTYQWFFYDTSGNQISGSPIGPKTANSTDFTFQQPGFYDVELVVKNSGGCVDTFRKENYVVIISPNADFVGDTDVVCAGTRVKFFNLTTPEEDPKQPYDYLWKFTHVDSSKIEIKGKDKDPYILFDVPGWYNGQLIVKSSNSCIDTVTVDSVIKVNGLFIDIGLDKDLCLPYSTNLKPKILLNISDVSPDSFTYAWENLGDFGTIGDTTLAEPSYTANTATGYSVALTVKNKSGCSRRVVKSFTLGVEALMSYKKKYCIKEPIWFKDSSSAKVLNDTRKWIIEPANYAKIVPNDSSDKVNIYFEKDTCFTVTLVAIRRLKDSNLTCQDTATASICLSTPKPDFETSDTVVYCARTSGIIDFTSLTQGAVSKYYWDFGDGDKIETTNGTPSHTYTKNNPSGYNVTLVAENSNGCRDTITKTSFLKVIGPVPEFAVDVNQGCDSIKVNFTDKSTFVKSFLFDYDDGTVDSNQIGTHTYLLTDSSFDSIFFYPTMVAVDQRNCNDFYQDTIRIYKTPTPHFYADTTAGCLPLDVKFTDTTKYAKDWFWDYQNDGTYDYHGDSAAYTFKKQGKYDVKLKVITKQGCVDSTVYKDFIQTTLTPIADLDLSSSQGCDTLLVNIKNNTIQYDDFLVDYGNGLMDTNKISPQIYGFDYSQANDTQSFDLQLIASSYTGCKDTFSQMINVLRGLKPDISINPTKGCQPLSVKFEDKTKDVTNRSWDFNGDGVFDDTAKVKTYNFIDPGIFDITLVLMNKVGCSDTIIKEHAINVHKNPVAKIKEPDTLYCMSDSIALFDQSTSYEGIANWDWKVFKGKTPLLIDSSDKQNPIFKFNDTSSLILTVYLTVSDSNGCSDVTTTQLNISDGNLSDSRLKYVTVKNNKDIEVAWSENTENEFEGYILSRNSIHPSVIFQTPDPTIKGFLDSSANVNVYSGPYCYFLQSIDFCGNISVLGVPHCSIYLTVNSNSPSSNTLTWTAYKGWQQIKNYQIYRSVDSNNYDLLATVDAGTTTYTDYGLCDQNYYYYIIANHPTENYQSKSNIGINNPPYVYQEKPLNLRYASVLNDSSIIVSWEKSVQDNVNEYHIHRGIDSFKVSEFTTTRDTFLIDRDVLVNKNSYQYLVQVEDQCGNISPLSNPGKTILLKTKTNIDKDRIELNWTPYKIWSNGISQYNIELLDSNRKFIPLTSVPDKQLYYIDKELHLQLDSAYCYRIIGLENRIDGDKSYSNIDCSVLPSRIYVPTAFSPNNDGLNDEFKVTSISIFKDEDLNFISFKLRIFNRWGDLLFETNNPDEGWDGTHNGNLVPLGAYIYWIKATGTDGKDFFLKGTISVIR